MFHAVHNIIFVIFEDMTENRNYIGAERIFGHHCQKMRREEPECSKLTGNGRLLSRSPLSDTNAEISSLIDRRKMKCESGVSNVELR